jgi:hypothetical protein
VNRAAAATPSRSLSAPAGGSHTSKARPIANPSRELVLSRREALSKRGKRADNSRDRTRTDLAKAAPKAQVSAPSPAPSCKLRNPANVRVNPGRPLQPAEHSEQPRRPERADRRSTPKRSAQRDPSRALVLARREALSKRGKAANAPKSTTSASVSRQGNPDMSARELSQKVRELKSKVGSAGHARSGGTRPTGPNRTVPSRRWPPMPTGRWG